MSGRCLVAIAALVVAGLGSGCGHGHGGALSARSLRRADELRQLMQNSELLAHPNVVFTPHIAFNSVEAIERINRATVKNIKTFFADSARDSSKKGERVA